MTLPVFKHPDFTDENHMTYGFFGRRGGASAGLYASLNCGIGSEDDCDTVMHNRSKVAQHIGAPNQIIAGPFQHHSNTCVRLTKSCDIRARPKADAMVTDVQNTPISILTADCTPVLFYAAADNGKRVIGAAHAGWKGAFSGILQATVQAMLNYDGVQLKDIQTCIGPCITKNSYEIDTAFRNNFIQDNHDHDQFFSEGKNINKYQFDLPTFCAFKLKQEGVSHIYDLKQDTYTNETDFFSYRRDTHKGTASKGYGRQISVIMLK